LPDPITSRVTAQYSAYRYPPPIMDLAAAVKNGAFLTGDPAQFSALIFFAADGKRTIEAILRDERFAQIPADQRTENARKFFERMWQGGHMFFMKRAV
jgi:hypothetical protein